MSSRRWEYGPKSIMSLSPCTCNATVVVDSNVDWMGMLSTLIDLMKLNAQPPASPHLTFFCMGAEVPSIIPVFVRLCAYSSKGLHPSAHSLCGHDVVSLALVIADRQDHAF